MDLPIALGLTLGLSGTLIGYLKHQEAHYADSLAAFIALMVVGRALERGMLVRNRNRILRSKGTEGLYARIRRDGVNQILKASEICKHDCLVVAPGEAAPVSGIAQMDALVSYDWIHGESRPVEIKKGELIQAGAINVGRKAFEYEALQTIEESRLSELLRQSSEGDIQSSQITSIRDFSAFWVIGILTIASIAFFWIFQNHGLEVALLRTTAILVVACPCAIGIAVPLSRELAAVELERRGVFIRRNRAFDRLNQIDTIALDKTGTLTTGKLKLSKKSEELIHRKLSRDELKALYTLVLASEHPKSAAIRKVIESSHSISAVDSTCVEEIVGDGLMALIDGKEWRLGRAKWAVLSEYWSDIPEEADVIFGCDGKLIAAFSTEEELRQDVQREITELRQRGYRVVVLSGDRRHRVQDLGMRLGFDSSDLYAELSPNQKADWLNGKRAFFVGDGVNDSLAADAAFVSASPAIERPFLPSKTDFVFWWDGIAPIRWTIDISHFLNRLTLSNIFYAVAYNAFGILAAAYGMFPPWLAAIAMPLSSILIVTRTFYRFRRHSESMNRVESRSRKGYAYAAENVRHSFVRG
ncbi:MAG: HAD-IC family P-type ATPase [Sandaracinaceae bacterium]|nr:HAD-IC family P-type ATPase [Sandaracinaceae bacterium]